MKTRTGLILLLALFCTNQLNAASLSATPENYRKIAADIESSLTRDILQKWFPTALDKSNGGFHENFTEDWKVGATGEKNIVYQARLTWLASQAITRDPLHEVEYVEASRAGTIELTTKLWDRQNGGFFWAIDSAGNATMDRTDEKHVYGIAFGIFALAESSRARKDKGSGGFALKAFHWLDDHAHDEKNEGYFEQLNRKGEPVLTVPSPGRNDAIGTKFGLKSMNTHIHVLEALTALAELYPNDPLVGKRLHEVFDLVINKVYAEPGVLHLYLTPDWKPISGVDSFGHDIEAAFLILNAYDRISGGLKQNENIRSMARHLVDHTLEVGFDSETGGFFNEGTVDGKDLKTDKIWWVQAEGLNALLLMHEMYGKQTPKYWNAFVTQWDFISRYQIDKKKGGWYAAVKKDGSPYPGRAKSDRWTEGYHQGRAMMEVQDRLLKLAKQQ